MLYSLGLATTAKVTVNIGIGQQCNGVYLFGELARALEGSNTSIDVSATSLGRGKQLVERYDLPVTILNRPSAEVVWTEGPVNLLYIDGNHKYTGVLGDLENWSRYIQRNGFIILDDFGKKHHQVHDAFEDWFSRETAGAWELLSIPHLWWMICRRT